MQDTDTLREVGLRHQNQVWAYLLGVALPCGPLNKYSLSSCTEVYPEIEEKISNGGIEENKGKDDE